MLLNIPVEDLFASQLDIQLSSDGRLSCRVKPNPRNSNYNSVPSCAGITLNLETENGYVLSLYASVDESACNSAASSVPFHSSPPDFSHVKSIDVDANSLVYPYADTSPPPDYFSAYNATSPDSTGSNNGYFAVTEHDGDGDVDQHFGFRYGGPSDMSDNNVEANQYPPSMGIVPTEVVGPSETRLLSPLSFHHTTPPFAASAPSPSISVSSPSSADNATFISAPAIPTPPPSRVEDIPVENTTIRTGRRAQYPCLHPSCDRVLTSPYTRQVHMGTHKAKVRKAFLCTLGCGEAFTRQHDRQRHEVALHGKQCKHVCQRCKRFFSSAKMLDRHVCRHREGQIQWALADGIQNVDNIILERFQ